jgi:hypothetical protein
MRKAFILIAISIALVPATIGQSMDVGQREFQNRLLCGPSLITSPAKSHIQRFGPNNNVDFVGYLELNVYNCASATFDQGRMKSEEQPVRRKRRRM